MIIYLPHYDTVMLGRPQDNRMISSNRYLTYSHPVKEELILSGFHVNFAATQVTVSLQNKKEKDVWVPFTNCNLSGVAGISSAVQPVLKFPLAIKIPPLSRIQIQVAAEPGSAITNALLTLVGVRVADMEVICST